MFARSPFDGTLTQLATYRDGQGGVSGMDRPNALAISPDGDNVYVVSGAEDAVATFSRNAFTGGLTFLGADRGMITDGLDLEALSDVAVSPDGAWVYVVAIFDDTLGVFSRGAATGTLQFAQRERDGENGIDGLNGATGVVPSLDGKYVYGLGFSDDALAVFRVNP